MALAELLRKSGVMEILSPVLESAGISRRDYSFDNQSVLEYLIEQDKVVRPQIFDNASDARKNSYVAREVSNIGNRILILPENYRVYEEVKGFKKGRLVSMRRVEQNEAVEHEITPEVLLKEALSKLNLANMYVGYEWRGISYTQKEFRICTLVESIEGSLIYKNASGDEQLRVQGYSDTMRAFAMGGYAVVSVPSVGKEDRNAYTIRLERLPLVAKKAANNKAYALWPDVNSTHDCPEQVWMFHYGRIVRGRERTGKEKLFCAHEVAAYIKTAEFFRANKDYRIPFSPFVLPTEKLFGLYTALSGKTLKECLDNNGKIRRRTLNNVEKEVLMWMVISRELEYGKTSGQVYNEYFRPRSLRHIQLSSSP